MQYFQHYFIIIFQLKKYKPYLDFIREKFAEFSVFEIFIASVYALLNLGTFWHQGRIHQQRKVESAPPECPLCLPLTLPLYYCMSLCPYRVVGINPCTLFSMGINGDYDVITIAQDLKIGHILSFLQIWYIFRIIFEVSHFQVRIDSKVAQMSHFQVYKILTRV